MSWPSAGREVVRVNFFGHLPDQHQLQSRSASAERAPVWPTNGLHAHQNVDNATLSSDPR